MNIYTNSTNSQSDELYFCNNITEFGLIKEISCVFDVQNLIFFDNVEMESRYTFIARTYKDDTIFLKHVNCGYVGAGPGSFARILMALGVPKTIADKIKQKSAVKVYFERDGTFKEYECPKYFMDSRDYKDKISLQYTITNLSERKLYLVNPEKYMYKLYNLLDNFAPYKIEYWIGNDSELDNSYRLNIKNNWYIERENIYHLKSKIKARKHSLAKQVSIVLYGEYYDILLLVPLELQISFLESIILFYKSSSFLDENLDKLESILYPTFYHRWFNKSSRTYLHGKVILENKNYE